MDKYPEIMTVEEAATMLQMNPTSLARKAKRGDIPGNKPGKRWIFVKEHLLEYLRGDFGKPKKTPVVQKSTTSKVSHTTSFPNDSANNEYLELIGLK